MTDEQALYEFKRLTRENWLEADPWTLAFCNTRDDATGQVRPMSQDEFLADILAPKLSVDVPDDELTLFEGARAGMCFGYFCYSLFMFSAEQLLRIAETAVRCKILQIGGPNKVRFVEGINYLAERGAIRDLQRWESFQLLRNEATHPKCQQLMPPGPTVSMLGLMAEAINNLFSELPE